MTDNPGWTSPGSPEPTGDDPRAAAGAAPGPATPQDAVPHDSTPQDAAPQEPAAPPTPGPYDGGYGTGRSSAYQSGYGAGQGATQGGWAGPQGPAHYGPGPYGAGAYPPGAGWGAPPTPKPGVIPLRPLGVGELLDGSVSTVRRHWRTALGISIGLGALQQTINAVLQWQAHGLALRGQGVLPLSSYVFSYLINIIAGGLLTVVVSKAVLGEDTTLREVWRTARPRFVRLLGLALLLLAIVVGVLAIPVALIVVAVVNEGARAALLVLAALLLLAAIPVAVWLGIRFSLAAPALVLERQGVLTAMRRSWRLVRGAWWRIFGIHLLTWLLIIVIAWMAILPFVVVAAAVDGHGLGSLAAGKPLSGPGLIVQAIGGTLISCVTIPISAAMNVLLYIDQRIRREALDIELARAAGLPEYGGTGWAGQTPTVPGQITPPGA